MTIDDAECCLLPGTAVSDETVLSAEQWAWVARRCPRNVTVVSAISGEAVDVITAGTFGVVSVDPPFVVVAVAARGRLLGLLSAGGCFAVSLLPADQESLARGCARPGRPGHWTELSAARWWPAPGSGAPLVRKALAWWDCTLHDVLDLADQALVIGAVRHAGIGPAAAPLVRFDGAYHQLPAARGSGTAFQGEGGDVT